MKWTGSVEAAVAEVVDWVPSVVIEAVRHLVEGVTSQPHQPTVTDSLALWPVDRCACYCYPSILPASMNYHRLV
jgi:hypothetical protein